MPRPGRERWGATDFGAGAFLAIAVLLACAGGARAENAVFTLLKRVTAAELCTVLDAERGRFLGGQQPHPDYVLPPAATAVNDVELWTVRYESTVPEQGNRRITASGLLVVPVVPDRSRLPTIIYEHGTVYGRYEVPSYAFRETSPDGRSHRDGAYETRFMAALFGGNGWTVMAADYFGLGDGGAEPEAYFVKASTQQAAFDLWRDVSRFLAAKGIGQSRLCVGGWSQGGLNATGLLERLERENVPVAAAFTASSPSDPFAALHGLMYHPRPGLDAVWLNTIVALSVFSFEHYHGERGLAREVLAPDVHDALKAIYDRTHGGPEGLAALFGRFAGRPLLDYFQPAYRDPAHFAASRYGRLLAQAETYRQAFRTPVRMYYGTRDEAVTEMVGRLAARYQEVLIGNEAALGESRVTAVAVPGADHRRTFMSAAQLAKAWLDGLPAAP